jgi:type IV pilus assembly protein PilB
MQASLTGHFVLSSLHAVDSVAAVHRFTDMGIEPFLVASALSGVVGQRLLRRICTSCAAPYTPTPAEIRIIAEQVGHQPPTWLKGKGCNMCSNTGFRGRVGVYELLQITDSIRELIVARATHHELRAAAVADGMRTMQAQAFELVVDGKTTVDDVIRSVYAPGVDHEAEAPKELNAGSRALSKGADMLAGPEHPEAQTLTEDPHDPIATGPAPDISTPADLGARS